MLRQRISRIRIRSVFKNFHSGDPIRKFPDTAAEFAWHVSTQAVFEKKKKKGIKVSGCVWRGPKRLDRPSSIKTVGGLNSSRLAM